MAGGEGNAVYSSMTRSKGTNWARTPIFTLPSVSHTSSFGAGTPILLQSPRGMARNITGFITKSFFVPSG